MKIPATWTELEVISASATTTTSSSSSSTSSSSKPRKNKPQQCLRFAPTITVVEIPNRSDYSAEEANAVWFQALDYEDFRENCYMTMGMYRAGLVSSANENEHCMRGLEGRLSEVAREREWTRYHATAAVLKEQYQQYRVYGHAPHTQAIADCYHAVTWKSQYDAYTQAMLDEQEQQRSPSCAVMVPRARQSDKKNLLRKIIDIERTSEPVVDNNNNNCSMQHNFCQATPAATADFDINSFFQELTISAQ